MIYREELAGLASDSQVGLRLALARQWPADWSGVRGRIDRELLEQVAWPPRAQPLVYVCGPSGFVEAVANTLVQIGHDPARIKAERFGPTGT